MHARPSAIKALVSSALRQRVSAAYKTLALVLLNTVALFTGLNVVLWVSMGVGNKIRMALSGRAVGSQADNPVSRKYNVDLRVVYPGYNMDAINALLKQTWTRPYAYEPFTQFRERPLKWKYVNVSEFGFRETSAPRSWPPDQHALNVFMFGGSTTFGYGVADDETIACYLECLLREACPARPVFVYNFGRGHYYSSQELVLFVRLLSQGHVPDVALFVDGLNEFCYVADEPFFTAHLTDCVDKAYEESRRATSGGSDELSHLAFLAKLPVCEFIRGVRKLAENDTGEQAGSVKAASARGDTATPSRDEVVRRIAGQYIRNKTMIQAVANAYHVEAGFVWQPVPSYKYDLQYHPFAPGGFPEHIGAQYGYPYMAEYVRLHPQGERFLWAADIQENLREPLYVDKVHYTAKMCKLLAEQIARELLEMKIPKLQTRSGP